tara:strand:+ start:151 stop:429 length:279 start_codon:yes stop_codon:yes gene_type:complete
MATYDKGDRVRITATFKTAGTNVATVSACTHKKPSGADINPTVQDGSGAGIYFVDIDLDQIGTHTIKIASTDEVIAAETIELVVAKSVFDHS